MSSRTIHWMQRGLSLCLLLLMFTPAFAAGGQNDQNDRKATITGKVTDTAGQPLVGAGVVVVENPAAGTVTDLDGNYSITVALGQTLRFSSIGYVTKDIAVNSSAPIQVVLEDDMDVLDDVIVIGYGTARKVDLTGSTSSLNGDRIKSTNSAQLSTQLQGQMAGVQVTRSTGDAASGSTIRVRGITTMSTNDPLVIIDGIPGSLNDVASEDVQDIQVLKDAASAAIYGSRAAAGVILVTTKRAKTKDFHLSYNFEYGIETPTTRPEFVNAVEWMDGANEMKYNDGSGNRYSDYAKDFLDTYLENNKKDPDNYPNTNWDSYLHKNWSHQRHSFNLTGGTEKLSTNVSLNYFTSDDVLETAKYDKYNVRTTNDYQINDWIHASADIALIYSKNNTPSGSVNSYIQKAPIYACYWSDGELADAKDGDNPYAETLLHGNHLGENFKVTGKLQLDLTPVKGLTITAAAAPNYTFYKGKQHSKYYQMRRLDGSYVSSAKTSVTESRNDTHSLTMQFYANYKLLLGNHSFSAMAGYEDYSYEWENNSSWRNNYTLDNYPYLNLGPADYQYNSGNAGHNAYRSGFGRLMYSFANRYLLQANFRADGSSRFAKGNRWGYFPSFSAGWVISEEPFFNNKGFINFLKLRASWGKLGNERIGSEFPYQALLTFSTNAKIPNNKTGTNDIAQTAAQITYAVNEITWETTTTYGAGIDMSMFDSRLRLSYDWYYKKTEDMLLTIGFPSYFGYNAPENNAADMYTKGWDFELSWNDRIGDFSYGASFNLSDYRSRMGYMADKQSFSGNTITEEGSYYQEWYLYQSKGIILNADAMYDADGNKIPVLTANDKEGCIQYEDIDGDNKITASNDRVRSGNSLPELLYGGSLWFGWKGLDFNLSFQGIGHQNAYWSWGSQPYLYTAYACPKILLDSHWSYDNDDATNATVKYPKITTNTSNVYAASTFWLFNGAYARIKNVTLGYTIPQGITKKIGLSKLRFYVSANDLPAMFHHYPKGYDPEWNKTGDYITTSTILGVNLTF